MDEQSLIYDWNRVEGSEERSAEAARKVELNDETLRDGLQCPSVTDPSIEDKLEILHCMASLHIDAADLGLPGAGARAVEHVTRLAEEIRDQRLAISPNCAARTVMADVRPVVEIAQKVGIPIEAATFIGSSPIRRYTEDWTLDRMLEVAEKAVSFVVAEGLPVMFVTEDTTRADRETLAALYGNAIRWGARRICLSDTVGHATPAGVRALVRFIRQEIVELSGEAVAVDWHGHRDRGLGIANALAAIEAGVDRVHGTALGIGERVGNVEMDLLLVNLALLGMHDEGLEPLPKYCDAVSRACGVGIPASYPVLGRDAFRTGTGVHAAAILKAAAKGDAWLVDRVYSGIPAAMVGREQEVEIGPMSGLSNVKYWLKSRGYDEEDETLCRTLFEAAKRSDHTLSAEEIVALISSA